MVVPTATKWRCQCGCRMLAGRVEDWRGIPKVEPSRCSPFPGHTARSQVAFSFHLFSPTTHLLPAVACSSHLPAAQITDKCSPKL